MLLKVWMVLKAILPTKKIGAWIVGVLAALVALVMGVANSDLKAEFCSTTSVITLPTNVISPATPAVALPDTAPTVKK